jgi:two-component system, NarL family, invasion response regulator UvrY
MAEPIRVLVIDDHAILRRGVIEIIRDVFPSVIIGEAGNGEQALQKCLSEDWDLVILDITLPILSGFEILRQIRRYKVDLRVIMLSLHSKSAYVSRALELGARGYLGKEAAADELEPAIRSVLEGGTYISREIAARLPGTQKLH